MTILSRNFLKLMALLDQVIAVAAEVAVNYGLNLGKYQLLHISGFKGLHNDAIRQTSRQGLHDLHIKLGCQNWFLAPVGRRIRLRRVSYSDSFSIQHDGSELPTMALNPHQKSKV